jgi:hypothetical protein
MSKNEDHHTSKMNRRRDNNESRLRSPVSKKSIRSKDKQALNNVINSGKLTHMMDEEFDDDDFELDHISEDDNFFTRTS